LRNQAELIREETDQIKKRLSELEKESFEVRRML